MMNGESVAGQCISHRFSCLPNLIPQKRESSHGNRDKEGRVEMSSFKSSSSSVRRERGGGGGGWDVGRGKGRDAAAAGGGRARECGGSTSRQGAPRGHLLLDLTPPHQRHTLHPSHTSQPPQPTHTRRSEMRRQRRGWLYRRHTQGKQFHRQRVLLQELQFGKFGPLG